VGGRHAVRATRSSVRGARAARRAVRGPRAWVRAFRGTREREPAIRIPSSVRQASIERGQDIRMFAAGAAFYGLVAVVPLAIFVLWIASLVAGADRQLAVALSDMLPAEIGVGTALKQVADLGPGLGIAAALAALWPATAYGAALRRSFGRLAGRRDLLDRPSGRGALMIVVLPVLVLGTMLGAFAPMATFEGGIARVVGWVLGFVLAFLIAALALYPVYGFLPFKPLYGLPLARAMLFAALGIAVLTLAFVIVLSVAAQFGDHFAISAVVGLLLLGVWLYLASAIVLFSYELARPR